jgi:hypothetical protein
VLLGLFIATAAARRCAARENSAAISPH